MIIQRQPSFLKLDPAPFSFSFPKGKRAVLHYNSKLFVLPHQQHSISKRPLSPSLSPKGKERCFSTIPNFLFFHINYNAKPNKEKNFQLSGLCADGLPFGKVGMGPRWVEMRCVSNGHSAAIPASETLSNLNTPALHDVLPW